MRPFPTSVRRNIANSTSDDKAIHDGTFPTKNHDRNSLKEGLGFATDRAKPKARGAKREESLKAFIVAFNESKRNYPATSSRKLGGRRRERFQTAKRQVSVNRREDAR